MVTKEATVKLLSSRMRSRQLDILLCATGFAFLSILPGTRKYGTLATSFVSRVISSFLIMSCVSKTHQLEKLGVTVPVPHSDFCSVGMLLVHIPKRPEKSFWKKP